MLFTSVLNILKFNFIAYLSVLNDDIFNILSNILSEKTIIFSKAASERGLIFHVTKQNLIMDGSLQSDIIATVLGMVAQIEKHLIQTRTKEALSVARQRGIKLGRPKGSTATQLKLDNHIDEIQAFIMLVYHKTVLLRH